MTQLAIPDPPKSRRQKTAPDIKPPPAQCPACKSLDRYPSVTQIGIEDWRCQQCHRFLAWIKHPIFNR
ncbi:MAG: hypothetical protein KME45_02920 [Stenomitos rutilans HA7619-LM2]|nr:hypothetical protein [Stenomitos rutilans HA7619-LM2]MBW4469336.1 hypothetical protein [Stenomitos rutilans HA7619-LM2]